MENTWLRGLREEERRVSPRSNDALLRREVMIYSSPSNASSSSQKCIACAHVDTCQLKHSRGRDRFCPGYYVKAF